MLIFLKTALATLFSIFHSCAALELENLAPRHQIGILQRSARKRPKLTPADRLFWVGLSHLARLAFGTGHRQTGTVVAWHRAGFGRFWTWKVRRGQLEHCPAW